MKNKILLYLFIHVGFFACSGKHISKETSFVRIDARFTNTMALKLSDFAESIELIPLQTNDDCLLAVLAKIKFINNKYYIGTGTMQTDRILVFDKEGSFLYKLEKRGQGPGEYTWITDFDVMDNSNVIVVSNDNPKFYMYDLEQNVCLINKRLDYFPRSIIHYNEYIVLLNRGVETSFTDGKYGRASRILVEYDIEGNVIDSYYSPNEVMRKKITYVQPSQSFMSTGDHLYFKYNFCDTIFELKNKELIPVYYIDFGDKKIPEKIFKDDNIKDALGIVTEIRKNRGVFGIKFFSVSPDFIHFSFEDSNFKNNYVAFYNMKNQETILGNKLIDDMYFHGNQYVLKYLPKNIDGEDLIWPVEAEDLKDAYKSYRQRATKEEWEDFCSKHARVVAICENLKEDDNPVLVRIKIKLK